MAQQPAQLAQWAALLVREALLSPNPPTRGELPRNPAFPWQFPFQVDLENLAEALPHIDVMRREKFNILGFHTTQRIIGLGCSTEPARGTLAAHPTGGCVGATPCASPESWDKNLRTYFG